MEKGVLLAKTCNVQEAEREAGATAGTGNLRAGNVSHNADIDGAQ